jgi:hypothetical protein
MLDTAEPAESLSHQKDLALVAALETHRDSLEMRVRRGELNAAL